ncbi:family 31 putative glycosyltransferase [Podospora australis]|uniref:N-acetylgalactosaminide beta-1,3-galactosyltransferase n=1 Tax=Podospora australis TaxID=1536484 RepID=A0AAN6WRP4_9PEZI|nr:family 31 putative glycosyltransferase [Podospora australis]
MIVTYRNNRFMPAVLIACCLWGIYYLVDVPVDGTVLPAWKPGNYHSDVQPAASADSTSTWSSPIPTPTPQENTASNQDEESTSADKGAKPQSHGGLLPEDVLLVMKTGSTSMWKRLLVHLTTSLAPERIPLENSVIYSDGAMTIGSFQIIDVLANTTAAIKESHPDFDVYRQQPFYDQHNAYVEAAGVEGDNYGPPGGWIVDKYKFVPLMQHAGINHPKAKWYIYMEDDTYLFLPNILAYLSKYDHTQAHYLGSFAGKSDIIFAHGGAGFAVSRGAWEKSFGQNANLAKEYEQYTADHCCGDQVLGHALNKYGVKFGENNGDEKFTWGFNPVVHWRFGFEKWNFCSPLLSWHKVHNRDVARYYDLEKYWNVTEKGPLTHRDFYLALIKPDLEKRAEWWDNMAEAYQVSSGNKAWPPTPKNGKHDEEKWKAAWESADACEEACVSWDKCVQWNWVEDLCKMDERLFMGQGYAPAAPERKTALKRTSGWLTERVDEWTC